jgi:hypothetical protein
VGLPVKIKGNYDERLFSVPDGWRSCCSFADWPARSGRHARCRAWRLRGLHGTGNEQGGKVPYAEGGIQAAGEAAQTHCRQYGKKAAITAMTPSDGGGGTVGFQCR